VRDQKLYRRFQVCLALAAAVIATVWLSTAHFVADQQQRRTVEAARQATRVAGFFEQHALTTLRYADGFAKAARRRYLQRRSVTDVEKLLNDVVIDERLLSHVTIIGPDGTPLFNSKHAIKPGATAKDRGYFLMQKAARTDEPYISPPHKGRNSGLTTVRVVRRISLPGGAFGGVVFAAVDAKLMTSFLSALGVGAVSSATLVGLDRTVRAHLDITGGGTPRDMSRSDLWRHLGNSATGNYSDPGGTDRIARHHAFRRMAGFPLVVDIGVGLDGTAGPHRHTVIAAYLAAGLLSAVVAIMVLMIWRETSVAARLGRSRARLTDAIESISDGFVFYDADERLVLCNSRYRQFYPWIADVLVAGTPLRDIARTAAERGQDAEPIADIDAWVDQRLALFRGRREGHVQHLQDGRWVACSESATADGGMVGIRTDVTERVEAERAARDSEARLRSIIDGSTAGIVLRDLEGRFVWVNKTYANWSNLSESEMIGLRNDQVYLAASALDIDDRDRRVIDGGEEIMTEISRFFPDGIKRTAIAHKFPIRGADGEITGVGSIITDITDRMVLEAARREAESRFKAVVDASPSAILVKDARGGYLVANDRWYEWFNPKREDIRGKTVFDFFDLDHAEGITVQDQEVVRTRQIVSLEYQTPLADGHRITTLVQKFPIVDDNDNVIAIGGMNSDISAIKQADAALMEAESRFRAIVDSSPAGITVKDRDGRFLLVNKSFAQWMEKEPAAFVGRTMQDFFPEGRAEDVVDRDRGVIENGEDNVAEIVGQYPDGHFRTLISHKCPIYGADGEITAVATILTDVSGLKQAEAHLLQADKLATLGRMAGGISHELSQPMNNIRLATQSMLLDMDGAMPSPEGLREELQGIEAEIVRMAGTIEHMRVFAGADESQVEDFSPIAAAANTVSFIRQQLVAGGITFDVVLPPTCGFVRGPQVRVEQVVLNLLSNARDAIVELTSDDAAFQGIIRLEVMDNKADGTVCVVVEDNGGGIADDVEKRIFDPFFTTKEVGLGAGLGLSVSLTVIDAMGGSLSLEKLEGGSRFRVTLPRTAASAAPVAS